MSGKQGMKNAVSRSFFVGLTVKIAEGSYKASCLLLKICLERMIRDNNRYI